MHRYLTLFLLAAGYTASAAAATIQGQVVAGATNAPLAGARVSLNQGGIWLPYEYTAVYADAEGHYRIDLPAQYQADVVLIASAAGHAAVTQANEPCHEMLSCFSHSTLLPVAPGSAITADFRLPPQARISGRMTDLNSGAGVYGALRVTPLSGTPAFLETFIWTDAEGYFSADALHAGSYRILAGAQAAPGEPTSPYLGLAWPADYCDGLQHLCDSAQYQPLFLSYGQHIDGQAVLMRKGGFLRARLLSLGTGQSVQTGAVAAKASQLDQRVSGYNRADGYAYIGPLLPGPIKLMLGASPESYPSVIYSGHECDAEKDCDLALGETFDLPFEPLLVTLPDTDVAPRRSIRGRVTDSNGQPLAGIRVAAGSVTVPLIMLDWGFQASASAVTDANGEYRLENFSGATTMVRTLQSGRGLIDRTWQQTECVAQNLFCHHEGIAYDRLAFDTEPHPAGVDFTLRSGGALEGRVLQEDSGEPLAQYAVAVIPVGQQRISKPVRTAADGQFRFDGLDPGAYFLFAAPHVSVSNNYGLVYPDRPCNTGFITNTPPCDLTGAQVFWVEAGGGVSNVEILIPPEDRLFASGFD
jgi:Carboxypeptidase regulatory-like domain